MKIVYKAKFVRIYKKLPLALKNEVKEKIELFTQDPNHPQLKTHKLKGKLSGKWSFSVNYKDRVIFQYEEENKIALISFGDHSVYQ